MVWEGMGAVKTGRKMLGATKPADSEPGTIRGDYAIGIESILNAIFKYIFFTVPL